MLGIEKFDRKLNQIKTFYKMRKGCCRWSSIRNTLSKIEAI